MEKRLVYFREWFGRGPVDIIEFCESVVCCVLCVVCRVSCVVQLRKKLRGFEVSWTLGAVFPLLSAR